MVAQNTTAASLAALSQDERTILKTLIDCRHDIHHAAAALNLDAVDLLLWLQQPNIRVALDALQQVAEQALTLRLLDARRSAIDLLERAACAAQTPLELRRAAAALARAVASAGQRTAAKRPEPPPEQPRSPREPATRDAALPPDGNHTAGISETPIDTADSPTNPSESQTNSSESRINSSELGAQPAEASPTHPHHASTAPTSDAPPPTSAAPDPATPHPASPDPLARSPAPDSPARASPVS